MRKKRAKGAGAGSCCFSPPFNSKVPSKPSPAFETPHILRRFALDRRAMFSCVRCTPILLPHVPRGCRHEDLVHAPISGFGKVRHGLMNLLGDPNFGSL